MDQILVSVIIPVFNTCKYVYGSAMSALKQTGCSLEIILVDDGSYDGSAAVCDELCQQNENVLTVHKPNGGLSSARNIGIDLAVGKYVLFLDSDDELVSNSISDLVEIAESEDSDIVIPDRYIKTYENSDRKKNIYHFGSKYHISDPVAFAMHVMMEKGRAWRSTALLYRRARIQDNAIRFPEIRISEDIVFNLRFFSYINRIEFCRKPTLYNLVRAGSISHTYDPEHFDTILYIDRIADEFLITAGVADEDKIRAVDSLLMGNTAIYLTQMMDPLSKGFDYKSRKAKFREIACCKRVTEAKRQQGLECPCFTSGIAAVYIRIMYVLLARNLVSLAAMLAYMVNTVRNYI